MNIARELIGSIRDVKNFDNPKHKLPSSRMSNIYGYQRLRMSLDKFASSLVRTGAQKTKEIYYFDIDKEKLTPILACLTKQKSAWQEPSSAGAELHAKGKDVDPAPILQIPSYAFSKYWNLDKEEDSELVNSIVAVISDLDIMNAISACAGYEVALADLNFDYSEVAGENSNSEWHTDCYCATAKCYIFIADVEEDNSPFQYMLSTYHDTKFRRKVESSWRSTETSSARLRGRMLGLAERKYTKVSCTGKKGKIVVANTSGFHRKGPGREGQIRKQIGISAKRLSVIGKLLRFIRKRSLHKATPMI